MFLVVILSLLPITSPTSSNDFLNSILVDGTVDGYRRFNDASTQNLYFSKSRRALPEDVVGISIFRPKQPDALSTVKKKGGGRTGQTRKLARRGSRKGKKLRKSKFILVPFRPGPLRPLSFPPSPFRATTTTTTAATTTTTTTELPDSFNIVEAIRRLEEQVLQSLPPEDETGPPTLISAATTPPSSTPSLIELLFGTTSPPTASTSLLFTDEVLVPFWQPDLDHENEIRIRKKWGGFSKKSEEDDDSSGLKLQSFSRRVARRLPFRRHRDSPISRDVAIQSDLPPQIQVKVSPQRVEMPHRIRFVPIKQIFKYGKKTKKSVTPTPFLEYSPHPVYTAPARTTKRIHEEVPLWARDPPQQSPWPDDL